MSKLIYLSGAMESHKDGDLGAGWRKLTMELSEDLKFDFNFYNPCEQEIPALTDHFKDKQDFLANKTRNGVLNSKFKEIAINIVNLDINTLAKADGVILKYENVMSWGSAGEIALAYHYNIPIVTINGTIPLEKIPSWLIGCTDKFAYDEKLALYSIEAEIVRRNSKRYNNKRGNAYEMGYNS